MTPALDRLKPYLAAYLSQLSIPIQVPPVRSTSQDIQPMLKTMVGAWNERLRERLPKAGIAYVHELIDIRNRWAHEEPFSSREAARARDTAEQLGVLIGAPDRATTASPAPARVAMNAPAPRRESQRDVMRRLHTMFGNDPERLVREYAAAERRGEARRKRNGNDVTPEDYARALLADAEKKGWL